ncbi:MAG: hypothetical protein ACK4RM_07310 [Flavobacterium sp.]
MVSELRKSINSILYERTTSPLYGTFIISWIVFNWKIFYVSFFIDEATIKPINKIDYIISNCNDWKLLILYPVISTIILVTIIPFFANLAYLVYLYYESQKRKWKEESEKDRRITIEQAAQLKNEIFELELKHENRINSKKSEINILNEQINQLMQEVSNFKKIKVLYAQYGKNEIFINVTDMIKPYIDSYRSFNVDNDVFGRDPVPNIVKELFVVYSYDGNAYHFTANEGDKINVNVDSLIPVETDVSNKKLNKQKN